MHKKLSLLLLAVCVSADVTALQVPKNPNDPSPVNWQEIAVLPHTGLHAANYAYKAETLLDRDVVTCGNDAAAKVWKSPTGELVKVLNHPTPDVFDGQFSPVDNNLVATAGGDGWCRFWDVQTGEQVMNVIHDEFGGACYGVAFNSDGTQFATCGANGVSRIRYTASGKQIASNSQDGPVYKVAFKPNDSYTTAMAAGTGIVWVYDYVTKDTGIFQHNGPVYDVRFSPDGNFVATASSDGTAAILIWSAGQLQLVRTLLHKGPVRTVSWSDTGQKLLTASDDKIVREWDAATGNTLTMLPQPYPPIGARYMPGGSGDVPPVTPGSLGMVVALVGNDPKAVVFTNRDAQKKESAVNKELAANNDEPQNSCACLTRAAAVAARVAVAAAKTAAECLPCLQ